MLPHFARWRRLALCAAAAVSIPWAALAAPFTVAVIPDTQNYLDYTHQKAEGFPFDAREMLFEQLRFVAGNTVSEGGDIAFVTAVGDVWQHQSLPIDPAHAARGFTRIASPLLDAHMAPTPKTLEVEAPAGRDAYRLLAGKVPFSVVPGNHDYDAQWPDSRFKPEATYNPKNPLSLGMLHVGGLSNWTSVFGAQSEFFKDKPWYVASFNGGADSAQVFEAGGYKFLHIGLEFAPRDEVLKWAEGVIRAHPGLPTIVSTHDFLNTDGSRTPNPMVDARAVDPLDNNPQDVWDKFISRNDQIFLVLSGHEHAQARRTDPNVKGHQVHQVLADYQGRGQTALDAGVKSAYPVGVGDGWLRLMTFDLDAPTPMIKVRTYSTHYKAFSGDLPNYAAWYRPHEHPKMTDAEFLAADDFTIVLEDFRARFGEAKSK